jgi:urease accessory protein
VVRVNRRSLVRRAFATTPLRLLTPRNHGDAAWVYVSSYGGGLVGGDDIRLTVQLGPEASAFLSSQASTKVYRSASRTAWHLDASVGAGGQLVVWPDPVVCFAGSSYAQTQRIELDAGAGLVLVDTLSSGRRASGERWQFSAYTSELTVRCEGRLLVRDACRLMPAEGDLAARMGRFDVFSTVVIAGARWRDASQRAVAAIGAEALDPRADLLVGAAPLQDGGCVLRLAGRSVEQVAGAVRGYLSFISSLLNDDPWARKW